MKNLINYIKDKIYYVMAATIILIILLIIISSCSNNGGGSYSKIEDNMVKAAKTYYETRKNKLPKEEGGVVQVTIGTLIDADLMKEAKDPNNKNQTCSGYVRVKKVDDDYAYIPFLTCKGNYEPKYLTDIIKNSKLDEYGNGVYEMDGEYVYRGDDVKNYVSFNNQLWRIVKVDKDGDIELIYAEEKNKNRAQWDTRYNSQIGKYYGVTDDYLQTNMRKVLVQFYDENIDEQLKKYIVSKNICIGSKEEDDLENSEIECSKIKENEKIGLLRVTDYPKASLDLGCTQYDAAECTNRNWISESEVDTWLLTPVADNSYEMYILNGSIKIKKAYQTNEINPVIYINNDVINLYGDGNYESPYIIK